MLSTFFNKIKRKPIRIITSYCRKKFQANKTRIYRKFSMYFILVDNDGNKVHRKFPIDTCLIRLKFFPTIRCYYSDWFSFYFAYDFSIKVAQFFHNFATFFSCDIFCIYSRLFRMTSFFFPFKEN